MAMALALGIEFALARPGNAAGGAGHAPASAAQNAHASYRLAQTLKVAGYGGWDPWSSTPNTYDRAGKLLYVSRYHRTQVIQVATGKVVAEIRGVDPRVVALDPAAGRGFITDENRVTVFDLKTYAILGQIVVGDAAWGVIYDPASKRVLVGCEGKIVVLDPDVDLKTGKPEKSIEIEGSPRGMVADGKGMVYVAIDDRNNIAVIDTREMRLETLWPIENWYGPRAICMDTLRSRLFIGCRARVVILSATDGHQLADLTVGTPNVWVGMGGIAFHDGKTYATCGEGMLAVIDQDARGHFQVAEKIKMPVGAWTLNLDPETAKIYLPAADPNAGGGRGRPGINLLVMEKQPG